MSARYAIGIVHYHSYDDLERCLESIERQSLPGDAVVVIDVEPDPVRRRRLAAGPGVVWIDADNRGYAGGANRAIEELRARTEADYLLLLNPDVELHDDFAERLCDALERAPTAALGSGKLLRRDGRIDSAGIELPHHRRPRDRGAEQPDRGQYDREERVFGVSGAAMMARRDALEALALDGEIFDEDFFLYHEDTDLSWRAQRLGWDALYVPTAIAVHERGWQRRRRYEIAPAVRQHSFKNHYLQLIKNETGRGFVLRLPVLAVWELLRLGFALGRDREVLPGYAAAWRLRGRAFEKRRLLRAKLRVGASGPPTQRAAG